jgi:predicted  nucleic acid-binding Zn-ribbon protein
MRAQRDAGRQSDAELREAARSWQAKLEQSREGLERSRTKLAEEQAKLPKMEQAFRLLQGRIAGERERG